MAEREAKGAGFRLIRETCRTCSLSDLCLPVALESSDVDALDDIVQRRRPLSRGDLLYRSGARFDALYAVRTGAVKSSCVSTDGAEQTTAFHLPGDLLGLDAIGSGTHPSTACAVETTSVCEIPFKELEDLSEKVPGLQRQLLRIMSKELFSEQEMLNVLARRTPEQRLAIVLINLSHRFSQRGLSGTRIRLPMSRHELSNYLGLAPETMSRLFRRFADNGWITAAGTEISLEDSDGLRAMASGGAVPIQREGGRTGGAG